MEEMSVTHMDTECAPFDCDQVLDTEDVSPSKETNKSEMQSFTCMESMETSNNILVENDSSVEEPIDRTGPVDLDFSFSDALDTSTQEEDSLIEHTSEIYEKDGEPSGDLAYSEITGEDIQYQTLELEPKDIEIEYDDTLEQSVNVLDSRTKHCDVKIANFKYSAKHQNANGRFKVSKLIHSHPDFFKTSDRNDMTNNKDQSPSVKQAVKKVKKEEWIKKKGFVKSKPKKEEWVKSRDTSSPEKDENISSVAMPNEQQKLGPSLKEVTIRNVKVEVERLHKSIVNFKHKQYLEFVSKQHRKETSSKHDTKAFKFKSTTEKNLRIENKEKKDCKDNQSLQEGRKSGQKSRTNSILKEEKQSQDKSNLEGSTEKIDSLEKSKNSELCEKKSEIDTGMDRETSVVANPFFALSDTPEKEHQEKEKEKLVEMLYSLIKGKPVEVKKELDTEESKVSEISRDKTSSNVDDDFNCDGPNSVVLSKSIDTFEHIMQNAQVTKDFESTKPSDDLIQEAADFTYEPPDDDDYQSGNYGFGSDNEGSEDLEETAVVQDILSQLSFQPSTQEERNQFVISNLFQLSEEFILLREILCRCDINESRLRSDNLTLGDIEDCVKDLVDFLKTVEKEKTSSEKLTEKMDTITLKSFKMNRCKVDITNIAKIKKFHASYQPALEYVKETNVIENNVHLWNTKKIVMSVMGSLSAIKGRYLRKRSMSACSDDIVKRKRNKSESSSKESSGVPKPAGAVKKTAGRNVDSDSDSDNCERNLKEDRKSEPQVRRHQKERKNSDPNRFKIPKKDKSVDSNSTMKNILEQGLRKVENIGVTNPNVSRQGRYHDWRKEQRIKEMRKREKIIDIKKIEEQTSKLNSSTMDNIISSMDKITTKKPPLKDKDEQEDGEPNIKPSQENLTKNQLKEREEEKIRQQERRRKELVEAKVTAPLAMEDLTSDEWGSSLPLNHNRSKPPITFKPNVPSNDNDFNQSDDDLPDPVSAVPEMDNDDDMDEDGLPTPVPAVPMIKSARLNTATSAPTMPEITTDSKGQADLAWTVHDEQDIPDDGMSDIDTGAADDCIDIDDNDESKSVEEMRSRTPSPFLRTNRYYPEFYSRKKETISNTTEGEVNSDSSLSMPKQVHPFENPGTFVDKEECTNLPTDIDQRIAKHFRNKRHREEIRKNKKDDHDQASTKDIQNPNDELREKLIKGFDIDPNSSFMVNPLEQFSNDEVENAPESNLGSRLSGAGLGLFINKVISSLKDRKSVRTGSSLKTSQPTFTPQSDRKLSSEAPYAAFQISGCPPPLPKDIPLPPPPPEVASATHLDRRSPSELEPGELPESPKQSGQTHGERNYSNGEIIDVQEADLDDSMILEIVGELDDTLQEEEKLSRAKEKLAKHLLNKHLSGSINSISKTSGSLAKKMVMDFPMQKSIDAEYSDVSLKNRVEPPDFSKISDIEGINDIDNFASTWGVGHKQKLDVLNVDYSSALSKLRGGRESSMTAALEKLRSLKRRTEDESQFVLPRNKQSRLDPGPYPDFSSSHNGNMIEPPSFLNRPNMGEQIFDDQARYNMSFNFRQNIDTTSFVSNNQDARLTGQYMDSAFLEEDPDKADQGWRNFNPRERNSFESNDFESCNISKHKSGSDWRFDPNNKLNRRLFNDADSNEFHGNNQQPLKNRLTGHSENYEDSGLDSMFESMLRKKVTTTIEQEYLEGFLLEWNEILSNSFRVTLDSFRHAHRSAECVTSHEDTQDLGSLLDDCRFNMKVTDSEGKEISVFTHSQVNGVFQLKCEICPVVVTGKRNLESHLNGKKHKSKLEEYKIVENSTESKKKAVLKLSIQESGVLSDLLKVFKAAPLIGLEYIVEVFSEDDDPEYHCMLCQFCAGIKELMYHLLSAEHRLIYLDKFFPCARSKFSKVPNRRFWEKTTYSFLESVVNRIEFKFGRRSPMVSQSLEMFQDERFLYEKTAENTDHPRETSTLDFSSLPDPFGTYLCRIPRHQIFS